MVNIRCGDALRLHVKHLDLNVHGFVNVGLMIVEAYRKKGHMRGLTEPRYMRPERIRHVQEQETEALLSLFRLLANLQSISVHLSENHDPSRPDGWDDGPQVRRVEQWLKFNDWNSMDYLDHRNYHYEDVPVLYSIIFALERYPLLIDFTLGSFNVVRLAKGQYEDEDHAAAVLRATVCRQERLSLILDYHDYLEIEDTDLSDEAKRMATQGPGMLIQHASQCTELRLRYTTQIDDSYDEEIQGSHFAWVDCVKESPAFTRLILIHLTDIICTPKELLRLLIFHSPSLQELYLQNITFADNSNTETPTKSWTSFFEQLKANTTLRLLELNLLFNRADRDHRIGSIVDDNLYLDYYPRNRLPAIHHKTIAWFLDKGLSDDQCPLNDLSDMTLTDTWAEGLLYRRRYGEGFQWGTFQM